MSPANVERIDRIVALAALCYRSNNEGPLREAIASALKYQDRDTRHACAEAVCAVTATAIAADPAIIDALRQAESACMNSHAT